MTATRRQRGHWMRTTASAAVALLLLGATIGPAAADLDELEEQQEQVEQEREEVVAALEGTDTALAETYLELDDINRRLPVAQQELVVANEELAASERHLDEVQGRLEVARQQQTDLEVEIAAGEAEIDDTEYAMGEVARTAYRGGDGMGTLSLIFGAGSAEEFASDYSAMSSALRTQNQTLTDLENLQAVNRNRQVRLDAVEERIVELEIEAQTAVEVAEVARQRASDLVVEITQLKSEQETKAAELEQAREDYAAKQAELEAENERLSQEIADEIAAIAAREAAERERQRQAEIERQQQQQQSSGGGGGGSGGGAGGGGSGGGGGGGGGGGSSSGFISPVSRSLHVTSPYGMRWYPITGGYWFHQGVDLRSGCGESQMSVASGTVVGVRPAAGNGTHGNQVLVNHGVIGGNSWVSVYNHLSRFAVSVGQSVSQGQAIGYTGATGNVTGCHVHLELWRNGATVNPMPYIS
ncbi:M23 family metallopeptidase [Pseudactinotalea suaedae]|uniref:M23 family metallopeptidase n=1 Tax=Pseudactinotalea suaedae TaxID=1524924 RepID=UPI0012E1D78A|nr:M23 family metallopeptidase [Pseudactinotalea suaedae]